MKGFLLPREIAKNVVEASKKKSRLRILPLLLLGILAGVYIGFGAELCTITTYDLSIYLGMGFSKFIGGSVFSVGLILVAIGGAELFTGSCLMLTGVLTHDVSIMSMLRNWLFVYLANFVGSMLLVIIIYYSGIWKIGNFGVGVAALTTAAGKVNLSFVEAFLRRVGCNWLVCLAIWLSIAGRDIISKIIGIYFPVMAFVVSGFEHSIANMYFIPMGLFLKGNAAVISKAGLIEGINNLNWPGFFVRNLIPVTLGNIVGGAFFVGGIYYLIYLWRNKNAKNKSGKI